MESLNFVTRPKRSRGCILQLQHVIENGEYSDSNRVVDGAGCFRTPKQRDHDREEETAIQGDV